MEIAGEPIVVKREFKNVDDFKLYYESHKDEFKNKKSTRLNKEFKIDGYKISNAKLDASNGDIKLVKDYYTKNKTNINEITESINDRINELEHKIKLLTDSLAQIIDLVNSNSNSFV